MNLDVTDDDWRMQGTLTVFKNCSSPGLEHRILGEEQTLCLKGTGGLEPMVALACCLCLCLLVVLFSSCSFRFSVCCLYWAFLSYICNLVRF